MRKYSHGSASMLLALLFALLTLFVAPARSVLAAWNTQSDQRPPSFAQLADEVKHSVVNISTTQKVESPSFRRFNGPDSPFKDFFGDDFFKHFFEGMPRGKSEAHALGSGFIIDGEGLILTNNHVVEKATEIKVKLDNGKEYTAKVLGRDPKTDLALIQVKPDSGFPQGVRLGDSDAIRTGDWVIAVGNPFGLGQTVTEGIISAKGRIIGAGPYDDFLQTDASINPGNSGGPLFNMNGEVVGINTAIVAQGQGIGFAIPINMAKEILPQLKSGSVTRGWLGISIQDITPELAKSFNIGDKGVLIADVTPDGPADKAGLQHGDVVTQFNGKEATNAHTLSRLVASTQPDTKVSVEIIRDQKSRTIQATVGTMPQQGQSGQSEEQQDSWGITVQEITPKLAQQMRLRDKSGVVITGVESGSPADDANLQAGDVIREINHRVVKNLNDYNQAITNAEKSGKGLLLLVQRGEGSFYVVLQSDGSQGE
jgi:serine protease Do